MLRVSVLTTVLVPTSQYPPIVQYAVVMAKSERKADAHAFLDWLLTPAVQGNLTKVGLAPVQLARARVGLTKTDLAGAGLAAAGYARRRAGQRPGTA